jgi:hypothetical protein
MEENGAKAFTLGCLGSIVILILLVLGVISCAKDEPLQRGTYAGKIYYDMPSMNDTTYARRIFSANSDSAQWFTAPKTVAAIYSNGNSYTFNRVFVSGETWCYGQHLITTFEFSGKGIFRNDSLFENGVIVKTLQADDRVYTECGVWSARFVKIR